MKTKNYGSWFVNPVTYWKGDKAVYTGAKQFLHGAWFYEIKLVEGHLKGQTKVTMRNPLNHEATK